MPRPGRLTVSVASLAGNRLPFPVVNRNTKSSEPTLPGEISTWNITVSVWIWIASGVAAKSASARGGSVKRQPATAMKMQRTSRNSSTTDPPKVRVCLTHSTISGVRYNRFSAASASSGRTSASLISRMMPYQVSIRARKLASWMIASTMPVSTNNPTTGTARFENCRIARGRSSCRRRAIVISGASAPTQNATAIP
jgi:hypothetical protein